MTEPFHLLDVSDLTPEQIERVVSWGNELARRARIEELGRLATAHVEHRIEDKAQLAYYMAVRLAELAIPTVVEPPTSPDEGADDGQ